jgi:class 3 adenylate cyclase
MVGEELRENVTRIFREQWSVVTKKFIAAPEDLRLGNEAGFYESATVLYADLSGSTHMVDHHEWTMAAEVYKAYLDCAARIIKSQGGAIAAYDGDRIMAVFLNERKNTAAAKAALMINYAVLKIINPALKAQYPSVDFMLSM